MTIGVTNAHGSQLKVRTRKSFTYAWCMSAWLMLTMFCVASKTPKPAHSRAIHAQLKFRS